MTMIIQLMESIKLEFRSSLIASLLSPLIHIKTCLFNRVCFFQQFLASHSIKMGSRCLIGIKVKVKRTGGAA